MDFFLILLLVCEVCAVRFHSFESSWILDDDGKTVGSFDASVSCLIFSFIPLKETSLM